MNEAIAALQTALVLAITEHANAISAEAAAKAARVEKAKAVNARVSELIAAVETFRVPE